MFTKSNISKLEHRVLLLATSAIPIVILSWIVVALVYQLWLRFFPPEVIRFNEDFGMDPVVALFRLSVVLSLLVTCVLVALKRLGLSVMTLFLPVPFFVNWVWTYHSRWQNLVSLNATYGIPEDYPGSNFLAVFATMYIGYWDYLTIAVILFLINWQIRILMRDRELLRNPISEPE